MDGGMVPRLRGEGGGMNTSGQDTHVPYALQTAKRAGMGAFVSTTQSSGVAVVAEPSQGGRLVE